MRNNRLQLHLRTAEEVVGSAHPARTVGRRSHDARQTGPCSRDGGRGGTTAGAVAALAAVLCQGRVAITSRAFCAAPAVLQHRWRVI